MDRLESGKNNNIYAGEKKRLLQKTLGKKRWQSI